MILYRPGTKISPRIERARQVLNIGIDEPPERPKFLNRNARERRKFITRIEQLVRGSKEYKRYLKYIKENYDMEHCEIIPAVKNGNGKKYTIEIHHEPFQLSWITDTVLHKHEDLGDSLDPYIIADEIVDLHYQGIIGLIPLSKTMHELVTNNRIMIPLQYIYQNYHVFAEEYDMWIPDYVREFVQMKARLSLQSAQIQSDVILDPTVTYVEVEGYQLPEVPPEWEHALARMRKIESGEEDIPNEEEMKGSLD